MHIYISGRCNKVKKCEYCVIFRFLKLVLVVVHAENELELIKHYIRKYSAQL